MLSTEELSQNFWLEQDVRACQHVDPKGIPVSLDRVVIMELILYHQHS